MPFDEEELDPHGECAAEIARLRAVLTEILRLHDIGDDDYATLALIAHEAQKALNSANASSEQ
jgi:hypothetical protein